MSIHRAAGLQALCWLLMAPAVAEAQEERPRQDLPKVEVHGRAEDAAERRDVLAGKRVIGRRAIEASGQTQVQELLKQEPGVTVSGNGRVGLLGLPGYTQVLINGAPPPAGRPPLEMDLVHVERIEIVKGSLAEFGPYGVAGTINVVTRSGLSSGQESWRVGAGGSRAGMDMNVAASQTLSPHGASWRLANRLSLSRRQTDLVQTEVLSLGAASTGQPLQRTQERGMDSSASLSAASAWSWPRGDGERWEAEPSIFLMQTGLERQGLRDAAPAGSSLGHGVGSTSDRRPDSSQSSGAASLRVLELPVKWHRTLASEQELDLELVPARMLTERRSRRSDAWDDGPRMLRTGIEQKRRHQLRAKLDWSGSWAEAHELKAGATWFQWQEHQALDQQQDGQTDPTLALFGPEREVRDQSLTAFVQDEWTLGPRWALNLGLSHEQRRWRQLDGLLSSESRSSIRSPSAHLAWKLDAQGAQRLRLSLARSFQAPESHQLAARPQLNPLAPCPAHLPCGPNTPDTADSIGNPALRPEVAEGVNLSFDSTHGDQRWTLEAFGRRLHEVIGQALLRLQTPWAPEGRYVQRPVNLGEAWSYGLSIEARGKLAAWPPTVQPLEWRGALNLARSRLKTLSGPDNHLAEQSPWSFKLGLKQKLKTRPLEWSVDASWTPGLWTQAGENRRVFLSRREELGASLSWTFSPTLRLRLQASNLRQRDSISQELIQSEGAPALLRRVSRPSDARLGLQLELKP